MYEIVWENEWPKKLRFVLYINGKFDTIINYNEMNNIYFLFSCSFRFSVEARMLLILQLCLFLFLYTHRKYAGMMSSCVKFQ